MDAKYTHEWRFKEQDGDWTPWFVCTAAEAAIKDCRWDTEVRERTTKEPK